MSSFDRILGLAGQDDPETLAAKGLALRRFLLLYLTVVGWCRYAAEPTRALPELAFALLFTLCVAFGLFQRWTRPACEVAALGVLGLIAWTFPYTETHLYLAGLVLLIAMLFDPTEAAETSLMLQGLRWVPLLVLFWSGLKKLVYGYQFDATFVGQMTGYDSRFKQLFGLLLPADEHLRLVRLFWPGSLGRGPWTVDSTPVVALSNATWILQLVVPLGLLAARLRGLALAAAILLSVAAAVVTREVFHAALLSYLWLLYAPRDLNRKLLPLYCALFAWLLLIATGVLPRWGIR